MECPQAAISASCRHMPSLFQHVPHMCSTPTAPASKRYFLFLARENTNERNQMSPSLAASCRERYTQAHDESLTDLRIEIHLPFHPRCSYMIQCRHAGCVSIKKQYLMCSKKNNLTGVSKQFLTCMHAVYNNTCRWTYWRRLMTLV
jgi:hypothetical protein